MHGKCAGNAESKALIECEGDCGRAQKRNQACGNRRKSKEAHEQQQCARVDNKSHYSDAAETNDTLDHCRSSAHDGYERRFSVHELARYISLLISRRPCVTVSKINPLPNSPPAASMSPTHKNAVGNRRTKPVFRYSTTIGAANAIDVNAKKPPSAP